MRREYWDIVPDREDPGTVHLDRYERECSPQTIARIVGDEARRQRAWDAAAEKAKGRSADDPEAPRHFAMIDYAIRPASRAELSRRDEERKTLQFLRDGRT